MNKILIFAGTTEGRELAEFCIAQQIAADVSTATEYGASLLPDGIGRLTGRMNAGEMRSLLREKHYAYVIDATHPYAEEATDNILAACQAEQVPCFRLIRKMLPVIGEAVYSLHQMTELLNQIQDRILCTLGTKAAQTLCDVDQFAERIWLRILPSEESAEALKQLGFRHIIQAKGPFSAEDNIRHIRESNAKILLTKESGAIGGYPEKAEAAQQTGIRMITLCRPFYTQFGYEMNAIQNMLLMMKENHLL